MYFSICQYFFQKKFKKILILLNCPEKPLNRRYFMNLVECLTAYKSLMNLNNKQLAQLLDCSDSVVSLYLSGKSGLSLDKLAVLLKNGMKLEEAFGEDVAEAVRAGLLQNVGASDPLEIVTEGLRRILDALDGLKIKSKLKPNSFLFAFGLKAN